MNIKQVFLKNIGKNNGRRYRYFALALVIVMSVASVASIVLANAPATVTDSFSDSTKIASSAGVTVASGAVTLSVAGTWSCGNLLVDSRDAKTYATVLIGAQCWMAENMNIGTMTAGVNNQGTDCPSAAAIEKYCYSDNTDNCASQGGLYQWDQAMCGSTTAGAKGICPTGWHVPTDSEQHTLDNYLSTTTCDSARNGTYDCSPAGTSLKSGGASGFNGLLAGYRVTDGSFAGQSTLAYFWSSTESAANAWFRYLNSGQTGVNRVADNQAYGFSVRCLKD